MPLRYYHYYHHHRHHHSHSRMHCGLVRAAATWLAKFAPAAFQTGVPRATTPAYPHCSDVCCQPCRICELWCATATAQVQRTGKIACRGGKHTQDGEFRFPRDRRPVESCLVAAEIQLCPSRLLQSQPPASPTHTHALRAGQPASQPGGQPLECAPPFSCLLSPSLVASKCVRFICSPALACRGARVQACHHYRHAKIEQTSPALGPGHSRPTQLAAKAISFP